MAEGNDSVDAFFARHDLPAQTRLLCHDFVRVRFPTLDVKPADPQGYCSYTVCVGTEVVVQFRPAKHRLDIELASRVHRVYGRLVPETTFLGTLNAVGSTVTVVDPLAPSEGTSNGSSKLIDRDGDVKLGQSFVYSLSRIPGISLSDFRLSKPVPDKLTASHESVVKDFAQFLGIGWKAALGPADPLLPGLKGRVGNSLHDRLKQMLVLLPRRFHATVLRVMENLDRIEALPWVLTHGDVVPSNLMIEEESGGSSASSRVHLRGLLDWAEAEYLPFGVGLYGVEELFGESARQGNGVEYSGVRYPSPGSRFVHYPDARRLRQIFWEDLTSAIPELASDERLRGTVELARLLGILLWHGIAFDDGKLDRVVEEGRDSEEIQRLDLFLLGSGSISSRCSAVFNMLENA